VDVEDLVAEERQRAERVERVGGDHADDLTVRLDRAHGAIERRQGIVGEEEAQPRIEPGRPRLVDRLEAHRLLREPRYGQHPAHRTRRQDENVVVEVDGRAFEEMDARPVGGVIDRVHFADDEPGAAQDSSQRDHDVTGLDTGYFAECTLVPDRVEVPAVRKDIRDLERSDLDGFDAVVHLAALSNDPIGNLNDRWTEEINFEASVRLAELAREAGVGRLLFSSSCIMYGMSEAAVVDETAPLDPKTEYARSKVQGERAIAELANDAFSPVFLRNGTVYGVSPRMRFDTVFNDLLGRAVAGARRGPGFGGGGAVDARSTSSVSKVGWTKVRPRSSSTSARAAAIPISTAGWRMVVRGGQV